ncbi:hypothetical protein [Streptomyces sp. NPDC059753]|uniref:MoaF-related domain-containing protein n=1 Tax=Streptomyces sp. NPDC059753 TaxID=3346933 RepID=UPI0036597D1B
MKGRKQTMDYTTVKLSDGLYVVRWTEPDAGDHVTHIEDYTEGTCMASSVVGGNFIQLNGSWTASAEGPVSECRVGERTRARRLGVLLKIRTRHMACAPLGPAT